MGTLWIVAPAAAIAVQGWSEGRASLLQRKFGLDRSLMRGSPGTEIWVGLGIMAHNLWQAARRA